MTTAAVGYIELMRPHQLRHMLAKLKVELDGDEIAQLHDDESIQLPVGAGTHELRVKMSWVSSPRMLVTIGDGETVRLAVEMVGYPFRMFYAWSHYFNLVEVGVPMRLGHP